ncbi:hypothetical protein BGY98DRAFT_975748 [Russula aff. rugulosa BPL654]|nr:hypothetical protein BGY98DRAFT_975748 [Russula aff. rugulosa BPL654]
MSCSLTNLRRENLRMLDTLAHKGRLRTLISASMLGHRVIQVGRASSIIFRF